MTKPNAPDRYQCPICARWRGQHLTTGLLARHGKPDGTPYELCRGSLVSLKGLLSKSGQAYPQYQSPYAQERLF